MTKDEKRQLKTKINLALDQYYQLGFRAGVESCGYEYTGKINPKSTCYLDLEQYLLTLK
ncbi:hypothetical protein [Eubacterium maltosivorans]|uniref:hypothetical protein n=1 Tax=Eubacterium maltosivorans TaxID=2041044 RepID=UPI00142EB407|nr:hypothetical protein [Eubacterium maltosivorans]